MACGYSGEREQNVEMMPRNILEQVCKRYFLHARLVSGIRSMKRLMCDQLACFSVHNQRDQPERSSSEPALGIRSPPRELVLRLELTP